MATSILGEGARAPSPLLTAKQLAEYLHLNEKKVYGLANEGCLPGTKVTGKWLFPKELVDKWLLETSHGGVLTDRLILSGGDDPLLHRIVAGLTGRFGGTALINYAATGTRLGLELLASGRVDVCAVHWGPATESQVRHPALLRGYSQHVNWLLVRAFRREQGLLFSRDLDGEDPQLTSTLSRPIRWVFRAEGSGCQRFLQETAARLEVDLKRVNVVAHAVTDREAASLIARGQADVAPGSRASAAEFGLTFRPTGWESFDLVLPRAVYFRGLFQKVIEEIRGEGIRRVAAGLGGYDLSSSGQLVWSA